jgi:hypothetical protein
MAQPADCRRFCLSPRLHFNREVQPEPLFIQRLLAGQIKVFLQPRLTGMSVTTGIEPLLQLAPAGSDLLHALNLHHGKQPARKVRDLNRCEWLCVLRQS